MACIICNIYVFIILTLRGNSEYVFDLIKGVGIERETNLGSLYRLRSTIECALMCVADSKCKATNYLNENCELHTDLDCPFEENNIRVVNNGSIKAYAKGIGIKMKTNTIDWRNYGATDCYEGSSHDYNGDVNIPYNGYVCQAWYENDALEKPVNQSDYSTNYCRATEINGDVWCYSVNEFGVFTQYRCNVIPSSECNLLSEIPPLPPNSKPGKLSAMFIPVSTYECNSFSSGESIDHCPVSTCKDSSWSLDYSLSCTYDDCYTVTSDYKGKMSCTVSGIPCQKWNTNTPHNVMGFPRDAEDLDTNYCRDDPNDPEGAPWCYTIHPRVRWQFCPVPKCHQCDLNLVPPAPPNNKTAISEMNDAATFLCENFHAGVSIKHCPVSRCSDGGWSTSFNVSCSCEDCFIESAAYRGKMSLEFHVKDGAINHLTFPTTYRQT